MQDARKSSIAEQAASAAPRARAIGILLHHATAYDFMVWLMTRGRSRVLRQTILDLAGIAPGESVLDVGCGTGSLAIAAKRRVGAGGTVAGIDASPEMIARATKKAARAGVAAAFQNALAQSVPFGEAQFDAALSTIMLHHLPRAARAQCLAEMARVVKRGGRILVVDFGRGESPRTGFLAHVHRHGHVDAADLENLLRAAGLKILRSGAVGMNGLHFVLGSVP